MRLVFAGTPDVAVPSLQAVLDSGHEVVAVVTRPDAPAGRGKKLRPSPVREVAEAAGVEVLTPAKPSDPDFLARLGELAPQAAPVVAYGGLVPPAALAIPQHGWVNLHFSLLPAWRGAAPVQRAVMAGDTVTGATTFLLEEGLDTGPVLGRLTTPIGERETAGDVLGRLAREGAPLLVETLDALEAGTAKATPQPEEGVSHAAKLTLNDARIDWASPTAQVDRLIRGVTPAPGAWTTFRQQRLKVLEARPGEAEVPPGSVPGTLLPSARALHVVSGDGTVHLTRVQQQGRAAMTAVDWARGTRIEDGETVGA